VSRLRISVKEASRRYSLATTGTELLAYTVDDLLRKRGKMDGK
jgi:hypothetical protein